MDRKDDHHEPDRQFVGAAGSPDVLPVSLTLQCCWRYLTDQAPMLQ